MQSTKLFFTFVILFAQSITAIADQIEGKVVSVADGDTVTVLDTGRVLHKIRLSDIDAPERSQAFGRRSREYLASLVAGEQVAVETDKKDRYGRNVGKILCQGRDINLAMVNAGLAWHYKKYEREQPASDRLLYASAEQEARERRLGLWLDTEPMAPWDWRLHKRQTQSRAQEKDDGTAP
jgi:endonuclease YncB( thermonuclease family)